jgi:hypothetical protein
MTDEAVTAPASQYEGMDLVSLAAALERYESSHGREAVNVDADFLDALCMRIEALNQQVARLSLHVAHNAPAGQMVNVGLIISQLTRAEEAEAACSAIREVLEWCGNSHCIHANSEQIRGMHTQGPCRCRRRVCEVRTMTNKQLADLLRRADGENTQGPSGG